MRSVLAKSQDECVFEGAKEAQRSHLYHFHLSDKNFIANAERFRGTGAVAKTLKSAAAVGVNQWTAKMGSGLRNVQVLTLLIMSHD